MEKLMTDPKEPAVAEVVPETETDTQSDEVTQLQAELEKAQTEAANNYEQFLRTQAELANQRRRADKQIEENHPMSRAFYLTKVDEKLKDEYTQTFDEEMKPTELKLEDHNTEPLQRKYSYNEHKLPLLENISIPRRRSEIRLINK